MFLLEFGLLFLSQTSVLNFKDSTSKMEKNEVGKRNSFVINFIPKPTQTLGLERKSWIS